MLDYSICITVMTIGIITEKYCTKKKNVILLITWLLYLYIYLFSVKHFFFFLYFSMGMKWDFNMFLTCFMRFTKTELTNAVNGIMKGDCLGWTGAEAGVGNRNRMCVYERGWAACAVWTRDLFCGQGIWYSLVLTLLRAVCRVTLWVA